MTTDPLREALFAHGEPDECWPWTGARNTKGYGVVQVAGRRQMAHRVVYEATKGPIPDGLQLDHLCRNPPCVNPAHLFAGTQADNQRDARVKGRLRARDFTPADRQRIAETVTRMWAALSPEDRKARAGNRRPRTPKFPKWTTCSICEASYQSRQGEYSQHKWSDRHVAALVARGSVPLWLRSDPRRFRRSPTAPPTDVEP